MFEIIAFETTRIFRFLNNTRMDIRNARRIGSELSETIRCQKHDVLLDLDGIRFIDSAAFGVLTELLSLAAANKVGFYVTNMSPDIYELVCLMKLENTLKNINPEKLVLSVENN